MTNRSNNLANQLADAIDYRDECIIKVEHATEFLRTAKIESSNAYAKYYTALTAYEKGD